MRPPAASVGAVFVTDTFVTELLETTGNMPLTGVVSELVWTWRDWSAPGWPGLRRRRVGR